MRIAVMIGLVIALGLSSLAPAQTTQPTRTNTKPAASDLTFRDTALVDAIQHFRDLTGLNIVVDWKSLEEVGVSKDTPVSLSLKNVKIRVALKSTLENAAPGLLNYYVDEGIVRITTQAKADEKMITRIYPVQDLLIDIPNFKAPQTSSNGTSSDITIGGGSTGTGGGGGDLFNSNTPSDTQTDGNTTTKDRAQSLIDVIQTTIRPELWEANGGKARIRFFNGNLIVTAPISVHQALGMGN